MFYNAANNKKKKKINQTIPVLMNMIKVDIVKKLLFTEYNSQLSIIQFPIKNRNITMHYISKQYRLQNPSRSLR